MEEHKIAVAHGGGGGGGLWHVLIVVPPLRITDREPD